MRALVLCFSDSLVTNQGAGLAGTTGREGKEVPSEGKALLLN